MSDHPVPTPATVQPAGDFTRQAWEAIGTIRAAIDASPFVTELRDGTLDRDRFRHYMVQDALYLGEYGRSLAICAAQSTTADDLIFWAGNTRETMVVERELHAAHADLAGIGPGDMSPTCVAYTSYLLRLALVEGYPVLAAGVLPCFWIYEDVGTRLKAQVADLATHPYGDWISMYGDADFADAARTAIGIVERLAAAATEATRAQMLAAFVRAAQYEWMFWDAAHRREDWPVR